MEQKTAIESVNILHIPSQWTVRLILKLLIQGLKQVACFLLQNTLKSCSVLRVLDMTYLPCLPNHCQTNYFWFLGVVKTYNQLHMIHVLKLLLQHLTPWSSEICLRVRTFLKGRSGTTLERTEGFLETMVINVQSEEDCSHCSVDQCVN